MTNLSFVCIFQAFFLAFLLQRTTCTLRAIDNVVGGSGVNTIFSRTAGVLRAGAAALPRAGGGKAEHYGWLGQAGTCSGGGGTQNGPFLNVDPRTKIVRIDHHTIPTWQGTGGKRGVFYGAIRHPGNQFSYGWLAFV